MLSRIISEIGIFFLKLTSYLPFWFLYRVSDCMYVLLFHIIGYRKKVVFQNLNKTFPDKGKEEVLQIARNFYKHLCDIFLESLKCHRMSEKSYTKKIDLSGTKILNEYFKRGESVILLSMHYGNWEWSLFMTKVIQHHGLAVYNPQRNEQFDLYFNNIRSLIGVETVRTKRIYKRMLECQSKGILTLTWLGADQTPPKRSKFWTIFLNQETGFFNGPETLARRTNQAVLFQYLMKTGRGKYKVVIEPMFEDPASCKENEILKSYAQKAEAIIRENPEYYLWSHRRWKHKRPNGIALQ